MTHTNTQPAKKTDVNSSVNQEIKGQFIQREVFCNVNSLVEYCLKQGYEDRESPVNFDDIENLYYLDKENVIYDILRQWDNKKDDFITYANDPDTYNRRVKTSGDFKVFLNSLDTDDFKTFCDDFDIDCEEETQEIYEWWAVSSYLADKLKAYGQPICDTGSCHVWGRTCTGQAILLDGVISRICSDMEILDGQSNSWAKK